MRPMPTRPLPERSDPRAGWRHLGLGVMLILALLAGLDWHKRHPLEVESPPAKPPAEAGDTAGEEVSPANPPAAVPAPATVTEEAAARVIEPPPARETVPAVVLPERLPRPEPTIPIPERARERVSEEFRNIDRNGDGYLSPAEVEGRLPGVAREFAGIDRNGDRRLSLDEFITFRRLQFEGRRVQPIPRS